MLTTTDFRSASTPRPRLRDARVRSQTIPIPLLRDMDMLEVQRNMWTRRHYQRML